MNEKDKYYQILGLKTEASEKEIIEAYKVLVKVWNPDLFSDDPHIQKIAIEKIKEIDEAFKQLLAWADSGREQGKEIPETQLGSRAKSSETRGSVNVQTEPMGAMVFINGKSVGTSPYEVKDLPVGSYRVQVIKKGYKIWEKDVYIKAGAKQEVFTNLKLPEPPIKTERNQETISIAADKSKETTGSPQIRKNLFLSPPFIIVGGFIIIIVVLGYLLLPKYSYLIKKQTSSPTGLISPKGLQSPTPDVEEIEKIRSLFENIRKANLEKNIDLFMSCFSSDFKDRDGKKLDTLKMWENFNYLDLSYDFKEQTISDDTANVRLEWLVRTSQKMVKELREGRTVLDVTLKKEDGHWKIKEVKPIS